MTLGEKAGLKLQPLVNAGKGGELVEMPNMMMPVDTSEMLINHHISQVNIVMSGSVEEMGCTFGDRLLRPARVLITALAE